MLRALMIWLLFAVALAVTALKERLEQPLPPLPDKVASKGQPDVRPGAGNFLGVPVSPYDDGPPGVGNIHGVQFKVPPRYLKNPIEYKGESIWDPNRIPRSKRTYSDEINHITVEVHWPDMKPRLPENTADFSEEHRIWYPLNWITITVSEKSWWRPNMPAASVERSKNPPWDNGRARLLRSGINLSHRPDIAKVVHYEKLGWNTSLGLYEAVPVGPGTESMDSWNDKYYWLGDEDNCVPTLIACGNGQRGFSPSRHKCVHNIDMPDFASELDIKYAIDRLGEWRLIEKKARELILSFYVQEPFN